MNKTGQAILEAEPPKLAPELVKQADRKSSLQPPRVAVLVETHSGVGRDILMGIARYVRESGPWALHLDATEGIYNNRSLPEWLGNWTGDGIICRFASPEVAEMALKTKAPIVNVLADDHGLKLPLVHVDDAAVGRLGAKYLLERGFKNFGFVARLDARWSDARQNAFAKAVAEEGYKCQALPVAIFSDVPKNWDQFVSEAAAWIASQPKPLGLMLCYDVIGPMITQACRRAGFAVPEEVAIVGVDNDEPICAICDPPLTSISANHEEVGYQGAALLDQLMTGQRPPKQSILLSPGGIIVRGSTAGSAIEDSVVSTALRLIREHACAGLQVQELCKHVSISRSVLQRRFLEIMGHSLHEEILQTKLRKAQELLRETELPLKVIADKAGFTHVEYLGAVFKARLGSTPAKYRSQSQPRR
jgi:LacI family transcriptional regulator